MPEQVVSQRQRGAIMVSAHPIGCMKNVEDQVTQLADHQVESSQAANTTLVVGCSTGYGLSSLLFSVFAQHSPTVGICFEREGQGTKTATAGWYNMSAAQRLASEKQHDLKVFNRDCFSDETKQLVIDALKDMPPVQTLIYSVAAPVRTDPESGETYRSVLKPTGEALEIKTVKWETGEVTTVELPAADPDEVSATIKVMGGEDWERWIEALLTAEVLAPNFKTVAYSYQGPEVTRPIYRSGTIGIAKEHLEETAANINKRLGAEGGKAWTSINAAIVTQASAVIPAVPLYMSLLSRSLKTRGQSLTPLAQVIDLNENFLSSDSPKVDERSRIRLDYLEMQEDIQAEVAASWEKISTETLPELGEFELIQTQFEGLFGFSRSDVDYEAPVELAQPLTTL